MERNMSHQRGFSIVTRRQAYAYLAGMVILSLLPVFMKTLYSYHIFILTFVYIIATSSLRTLATSGQISMCHAAFMSIGAYGSALLARDVGWSPWLTMPLGALGTMVVAVLIGFPFARVRAIYFSMVSLFFGMGIISVNQIFGKYTGHIGGMIGIPPLFASSKVPYYYFFLGLTAFSLFVLWRFETCRIGVCLKAINQSHEVAASVGISEMKFRVVAQGVSCFIVGLAGAGYAHYNMVISYSSFDLLASIYLIVYMIVGGIGSFGGPIIGTAILFVLPELFRGLKEFTPYLFAAIILVVVFLMRDGVVSLGGKIKSLSVRSS